MEIGEVNNEVAHIVDDDDDDAIIGEVERAQDVVTSSIASAEEGSGSYPLSDDVAEEVSYPRPDCVALVRKPAQKRLENDIFPRLLSKKRVMLRDNLCSCCLMPLVTPQETVRDENGEDSDPTSFTSHLRCSVAFSHACNHLFHSDCIQSWSKAENSCPHCKARFLVLAVYALILNRNDFEDAVQIKFASQGSDTEIDDLDVEPLVLYMEREEIIHVKKKNLADSLAESYEAPVVDDGDRCCVCGSHHAREEMVECSGRSGTCRRRYHWMCLNYLELPNTASDPWFCDVCINHDDCTNPLGGMNLNPVFVRLRQQRQYVEGMSQVEATTSAPSTGEVGLRLRTVESNATVRGLIRGGVEIEDDISAEIDDDEYVPPASISARNISQDTSQTLGRRVLSRIETQRILMGNEEPELASFHSIDVDVDELQCPPVHRVQFPDRSRIETRPPDDILKQLMENGLSNSNPSVTTRQSRPQRTLRDGGMRSALPNTRQPPRRKRVIEHVSESTLQAKRRKMMTRHLLMGGPKRQPIPEMIVGKTDFYALARNIVAEAARNGQRPDVSSSNRVQKKPLSSSMEEFRTQLHHEVRPGDRHMEGASRHRNERRSSSPVRRPTSIKLSEDYSCEDGEVGYDFTNRGVEQPTERECSSEPQSLVASSPKRTRILYDLIVKVFDTVLIRLLKAHPAFITYKESKPGNLKEDSKSILRLIGKRLLKNEPFMSNALATGKDSNGEFSKNKLIAIVERYAPAIEGWICHEVEMLSKKS